MIPQPSERGLVRPGQGVNVERIPLAPIKAQLRAGTYAIDNAARQEVRSVLGAIDRTPPSVVKGILHDPERKAFRNAYASIVIEDAWEPYSRLVGGMDRGVGVFDISFDTAGRSSLVPVAAEKLQAMSSSKIADTIAKSNQDVLTHFICDQFSGGKIPSISGNPDKDREYFDTLQEQTDLDIHAGSNFRTIPLNAGSLSVFVTSGSLVLRTHIFGLPNVIDAVTEPDKIDLSPAQHRNGFVRTMSGSIAHYYLPTTTITLAVNRQLIDPETLALNPDSWTHNGNPDNLVVYPKPEIVSAVNDDMRGRQDLPAQTNCPAFHGRVGSIESPDVIVPLPRSLPQLALRQLDELYYPKRRHEYAQRNGQVYSNPN